MGKASRRKKIDPSKREKFRPLIPFVDRPFEGLTIERDLVAMRELIPCAVLPAKTNSDNGSSEFDFVTLLPDGAPAMVREDGRILVGLQTRFNSSDLSHDLAGALTAAIAMEDWVKQVSSSLTCAILLRDSKTSSTVHSLLTTRR